MILSGPGRLGLSTMRHKRIAAPKQVAPTANPNHIEEASPDIEMRILQVADIEVSDRNPRRTLRDMDELTASIAAHGLLQPLVVHRRGGRYELIAGHRRLEAIRRLGWERV